jgi:pre-mRNA-processing factor SLU7
MASSSTNVPREDRRKKKEIEEARKAGTLPPEQDEDGNMINPHNPEYISKRPWYLGESGPSLKHQNAYDKKTYLSMQETDDAIKTHGKVGVRSGKAGKLTYDAKRDPYLGYNPDDHKRTIERYDRMAALRRKKKAENAKKKAMVDAKAKGGVGGKGKGGKKKVGEGKEGSDSEESVMSDMSDSDTDYESDVESENEDFVDKSEGMLFHGRVARQGGIGGAQMKTTTRNLRIREDTAKYLRNLNPNSAYYDPKTRSMRDNPNPSEKPEDLAYAGDNFVRHNGDSVKLAGTQLFAWEAYEKGGDIHPQANATQAEMMQKKVKEKKKALKQQQSQSILDKYGGANHLQAPPQELLLAQTESYVEYDRHTGRVIKGNEKAVATSKYEEDALDTNHTAIWGSYFDVNTFSWGYQDDYSTTKNSYSTGEAGKLARQAALQQDSGRPMLPPKNQEAVARQEERAPTGASLYGEVEDGVELDQEKLRKAIEKEEEFQKNFDKEDTEEKKRKYNSFTSTEVTAEEMEAYRMKKSRSDDPMSKIDSEELLPMK